MSVANLAGLIVYRIAPREPIEYLLICKKNFNRYSHWYPPKGKIIGSEDELNCATRETLDQTGLGGDQLLIDESFRAELKYVDGVKPKQVVYVLARNVTSSRASTIHNDDPLIELSWCRLDDALGKVKFQSMQNILSQAEEYIESNRDDLAPVNHSSSWKTVGNKESSSGWRPQRGNMAHVEGQFRKLDVGSGGGQRGNRAFGDNEQWQQQPSSQGSKPRPQDNPLYKTRLCEKYERDGECPYNEKCVFAHSAAELRERKVVPEMQPQRGVQNDRSREYSGSSSHYQNQNQNQSQYQQNPNHNQFQHLHHYQPQQYQRQGHHHHQQQQQHYSQHNNSNNGQYQNYQQQTPRTPQSAAPKFDANPLYKTRLCQRFAEKGECPYNEKCQFAHGEKEMRAAPEQPSPPVKSPRDGQYTPRTPNDQGNNGFNRNAPGQSQTWRKGGFNHSSERAQIPNFNRNASWSNTARPTGNSPNFSDDGSVESSRYTIPDQSPKPADSEDADLKTPLAAPLVTPVAQKIPPPGLVKLTSTSAPVKKSHDVRPDSRKGDIDGEKPWIKVVEVSDQDLQQMGSPLADSSIGADGSKSKPISKTAELENRLAKELIETLARAAGGNPEPTLQIAFKEITHLEFRNNLGKQQLLNVVVTALFAPSKAVGVSDAISRNSELLAKIVTKPQDQVFMLNAWHRLLTEDDEASAWQRKATEVLGALYKTSLLDEDIFTAWFSKNNGESRGPAVAAMEPFANWLATAEEE
ncbi:hypothetical protein GGI15_003909 [Coemansia interrupta]|uniref:Uncharacterized protein n=1 Tax=Coemansia interrupta TaxID=1126814 RepID=A0A9W8HAI6_9FUNG|nr:hypothetical protein GGI15_003909 [Coemansia interrupta]